MVHIRYSMSEGASSRVLRSRAQVAPPKSMRWKSGTGFPGSKCRRTLLEWRSPWVRGWARPVYMKWSVSRTCWRKRRTRPPGTRVPLTQHSWANEERLPPLQRLQYETLLNLPERVSGMVASEKMVGIRRRTPVANAERVSNLAISTSLSNWLSDSSPSSPWPGVRRR